MEPEAPPEPLPKPKAGKGTGAKFAVVLVTLATIVGGVAAGFQIFDFFQPKPAPSKKTDPGAWISTDLGGGFTASLPPEWQVVDRDSLEALTRGTIGPASLPSGPDVSLHFIKERDRGPGIPSAFAMLGSAGMAPGELLENVIETFRRHPGCQSASIIETKHGPTARAILYEERWLPDGTPITLVMDTYMCMSNGKGWMAYFYTEPSEHLDQAPLFRRIFEGIDIR